MDQIGWYCGNRGNWGDPDGRPWEVRKKLDNAWGLYDMSGNVHEWCWDRFGPYAVGPLTDPTGPETGDDRAVRGGGWDNNAQTCRSAVRRPHDPAGVGGHSQMGFRPARWAQ
jgi:formylglycine-generating enzyme required for sulfatase activity